ncbi:TPA_asm: G [Baccharis alphacytorhabdovirus 1]|nr:TPA_asm: G [Baccharis alphacytorhabdovirus 1]
MATLLTSHILMIILTILVIDTAAFNHSIGPLAYCGMDQLDSRQYVEGCFQRCNRPAAPSSHGTLYIYSEMPEEKGPVVVHCQRVKITQTFTETWTLSQVKGTPILEYSPVSVGECKDKITKECPNYDCNIKAPSELSPEFHFASDTTLEETFISLISMPSSIDFLEENIKITPMTSSLSFVYSKGEGEDENSAYVWNPKKIDKCPFDSVATVGCDYYSEPTDTLVCRGSRIAIDSFSKSKELSGLCKGLNKSASGLLYKWSPGSARRNEQTGKMFVSPVVQEASELATIREQVSEALAIIDEDVCQVQCEIMEIVSRVNLGKELLLRLGNKYVAFSKTGFARNCTAITSCKISQPSLMCGNPVRIGVSCDGKQYMWNPLKSFVEPSMNCHAVQKSDTFRFSLGNHIYNVDQDIKINASDSDSLGLAHDVLAIKQTSLKAGSINIDDLRRAWKTHQEMNYNRTSLHDAKKHHVDHWDAANIGLGFLGKFPRVIIEAFSKVMTWTVIAMTIVALLWGYTWYSKTFGKRSGRKRRDTNSFALVRPTEASPKWI